MRPTWVVVTAAALSINGTHNALAFTPPRCASSVRRADAAVTISRKGKTNTCLATSGRRSRQIAAAARENDASVAVATRTTCNKEKGRCMGRWARVRRSVARGAASFTAVLLGTTTVAGLLAEVEEKFGGTVALPIAMKSAHASVLKPFSKRSVEEKLGNLPAFMVTNNKGSPYLTPTQEEGHQLAVFFTNLDDAKEMLREMVQSDSYAKDARILVVSMEKAYGMVRAGPRSTGYSNESGKEETMDFKLERDMHSFSKAQKLGLDVDPATSEVDIPVFYAEGLEIKRDRSLVRPLFMDPADLLAAWKKVASGNPGVPEKPTVKVFNFPEVIVAMERSDDLQDFGFFASSDSADYIRRGREEGKAFPKPRLGRMWSF